MGRSITRGLARTRAAPSPTVHTGVRVSARDITPRPAPMRAGPRCGDPTAARLPDRRITHAPARMRRAGWPMDRTAREARRRPTTHAPAPTARPDRVRTCMATGAGVKCSEAINGPRPHTRRITRPGPRRGRRQRVAAAPQPADPDPRATRSPAEQQAVICTQATTATSTRTTAAAGRSTTTADGTTSRRQVSFITIGPHAGKAPRARASSAA